MRKKTVYLLTFINFLFLALAYALTPNFSYSKEKNGSFLHTVNKNESLSSIAKKYGTNIYSIKKINRLKSNKIFPGQRLRIQRITTPKKSFHIVKRGETLSSISKKYSISVKKLRMINDLSSNKIMIGKKLRLKKIKITKEKKYFHKVKKGESLSIISKKYGVSVWKLKKINGLKSNKIFIGQKIHYKSNKARPRIKKQPLSVGTQLGLRNTRSKINLNSSAVLVVNQLSGNILLEKNPDAVLPIASITKLMTALVIIEKRMPLSEKIKILKADARLERYNKSRLSVGSRFTRGDLLHLALMSSENRAAHALARNYPGGIEGFVGAMNAKAKLLGMWSTNFTEPTGLNSGNVSSPRDLIRLVDEASRLPLIRKYSTSQNYLVKIRNRFQKFNNSNPLVRGKVWDLGVSKTGFIRDSGRCLVMQAFINNDPMIIIMLDAQGNRYRRNDAEHIKNWIIKTEKKGKEFRARLPASF